MQVISLHSETEFLGKPVWMWFLFMGIVLILLALDLGIFHRKDRAIGVRESIFLSLGYITISLAFSAWIAWNISINAAIEYITGFIVEKSLAMDNIFVIAMIFSFFSIPEKYQHRVLFWGILGVIILRAIMIGLGAAILIKFAWVLFIFAALLVLTGYKLLLLTNGCQFLMKKNIWVRPMMIGVWVGLCFFMSYSIFLSLKKSNEFMLVWFLLYSILFFITFLGVKLTYVLRAETKTLANNPLIFWLRRHLPITDSFHGHSFIVKLKDEKTQKNRFFLTPLFLALIIIEIADLVFAVDSVPAIFAITMDPFIVYTSNIFAILGLRALYFALSALISRFAYLKYSLALVLIFIGSKVFISEWMGEDKFPIFWSLTITLLILSLGFIYSIWKTRIEKK